MAYHRIEESKMTAIANAVRERNGITDTMNADEMPDCINVGAIVPSYWKSYLESKATEINTAINSASANRSTFLWYTDAHLVNNYGKSPMLLKYLSKNTGINKTFFGGDIAYAKTGEIATLTAWKEQVKDIPNHHTVIGNHDNQVEDFADASERADFFIQPFRTGDMSIGTNATNGKMYYFIDNYIEQTRYICLSTGRMWTLADEVQWCIDVLNSTPKNWHIVIISHLWLNNDYTNGGVITTPVDYTQGYLNMFDAYNYRQSGTESFTGQAYNFTNAQGKIEFIMGGHCHMDYDFTTATGIPVILTECDSWEERSDTSKATAGTTTENCVYAVVANYATKKVNVINVGRGTTRSVSIPDVATYTNMLKKAVNTDGSLYNGGKGYKDDIYIGGSGETNSSYWDATGYIPCKRSDTLRWKNCTAYDLNGTNGSSKMAFYFYDASFAQVSNSTVYSKSSPPAAAWSPVHGENGDLIQVTIPSSYKSTIAYVRITMDDIRDDTVITVNEEID